MRSIAAWLAVLAVLTVSIGWTASTTLADTRKPTDTSDRALRAVRPGSVSV
jgi:hypothetical protein